MARLYFKLLFQLLLLIVFVFVLYLQFHLLNTGRAKINDVLSRYQPISARVVESDVQSKHPPGRRRRTEYRPVIEYRYAVDGRVYYNTRYTGFDFYRHSQAEIKEMLWQYQDGFQTTAYYDPQNPSDSVLVMPVLEDFSDDRILYIIIQSLLTLVVGLWFFWSLRALKQSWINTETK